MPPLAPSRRTTQRALSFALLVVALVVAAGRAFAAPIPPGMESEMRALMPVGEHARTLPPGWTLESISIQGSLVRVSFRHPVRGDARIVLGLRDAPASGNDGGTRSFAVEESDAPPELRAALLGFVSARDDGAFLASAQRRSGAARPRGDATRLESAPIPRTFAAHSAVMPASHVNIVIFGQFVRSCLLAVFGFLAARAELRRLRERPRSLLTLLALSFALALAVRAVFPAWAPIHSDDHGITELAAHFSDSPITQSLHEAHLYGRLWWTLCRAAVALSGGFWGSVFLLNAVLSSLAAPFAAAIAFALTRSYGAALAVALVAALMPAAVVVSTTESPLFVAFAAYLGSVLALLFALRQREISLPHLALSALLVTFAIDFHVATLVYAPLFGLVFAAAWAHLRPGRFREGVRVAAFGAAFIGLFVLIHALELRPLFGAREAEDTTVAALLGRALSPVNLVVHPDLTGYGLPVAGALGWLALAALRGGRVVAAIAFAHFVVGIYPGLVVYACRTDAIRYQTPFALVLICGTAGIVLLFERLARSRMRAVAIRAATGTGLVALVATELAAYPRAMAKTVDTVAWERVRHAASSLDGKLEVTVPPRRMKVNGPGGVLSDFPAFLFGERIRARESPAERASGGGRACWVYVAPACYGFTRTEVERGTAAGARRFAGAPLRHDCEPLLRGVSDRGDFPFAARVNVPWRESEFHRYPVEPVLIGLLPCAGSKSASDGD